MNFTEISFSIGNKEYFRLDSSAVKNEELKNIIGKLTSGDSLQESLTILDEIPQNLMYSLILEEFRQNPDSNNLQHFLKNAQKVVIHEIFLFISFFYFLN